MISNKTIFTLAFLLLAFAGWSQKKLLAKHNFDGGGYSLVGLKWGRGHDPNTLQDSLGNFYTTNKKLLNEIKNSWIVKDTGIYYACGYHYVVYLCKNGKAVDDFHINLRCNTLVTRKDGHFVFSANKLRKLYGRLDTPLVKDEEFPTVDSGRHYLSSIRNHPSLLLILEPKWVRFEGDLTFNYFCNREKYADCYDSQDQILKTLNEELKAAYPGEDFEILLGGGSELMLFITLRCNQSLRQKFNLYTDHLKWRPYPISLRTIWLK